MCARWPQVEVVVADFADAAALGRERLIAAGLEHRVAYVAGDARTSALPEGFDVATLLSVLHNVDRPTAVSLLRRAGETSRRVVALELEADRTQVGAMGSLTFCGRMGSRAWRKDELGSMARDAGLTDVHVKRPPRLPGSVLVTATGTSSDQR